ncbi:MAG: hypothetical protein IKQ49_00060 [Eubacterium sp.]|nr:hypothetical protein [Eubacterium sp.]
MRKEKDRTEAILEKLREMIEEGPNAPLSSGKVMLVREEALELLDHLQDTVRKELSVYREVNDKRAKLLEDARHEAEKILYEAERSASRIRVTKRRDGEPLSFSLSEMEADERKTLRTANDIYAASLIYTDEMLTEVDHLLTDAEGRIEEEYRKMLSTLREKKKAISDNKSELIRSLNDLTPDDRYAQLLEIADLLSVELYREKQRQLSLKQEGQMEIQFDPEDAEDLPGYNPDRTEVKIEVESHAKREQRKASHED